MRLALAALLFTGATVAMGVGTGAFAMARAVACASSPTMPLRPEIKARKDPQLLAKIAALQHGEKCLRRGLQSLCHAFAPAQTPGRHVIGETIENALKILRRAHRFWERYRDAQCEGARQSYEGGSVAMTVEATCRAMVGRNRIGDLDATYGDRLQ